MLPLSIDLRTRVISAIKEGMHINDAVKIFNVSRRAIYSWLNLLKETNNLEPKSDYQNGHSHKITDWDAFRIFAQKNAGKTVKEMVLEWEKLNNSTISKSTIERALKKINYTFKKKLSIIQNLTKKNAINF